MTDGDNPETIGADDFAKRLTRLCRNGGAPGLPRRVRDRWILLKSVALLLTPEAAYSEPEINERLRFWLSAVGVKIETDHVALRRELVDAGLLERRSDGSRYRLGRPTNPPVRFSPEVDTVDILAAAGMGGNA